MVKKILLLLIIAVVVFFFYSSKQKGNKTINSPKVLGVSTQNVPGFLNNVKQYIPEQVQQTTSGVVDTSIHFVQKTASNGAQIVTNVIQCSVFKQTLPHISTLTDSQKEEIRKAVCK